MTLAARRPEQAIDRYPSRRGGTPRFLERRDPVVHGDKNDGPLSTQELERYARDGFLSFDALFDDAELQGCRNELERLSKDTHMRARDETVIEPDSDTVRSIFAVHELNAVLDRLCRDARVVDIARQLLGSDVYFHQTRVNYKPGFRGAGFYWHSDFETWHVEDGMPGMRAVSCSISLTPNTPHNGPLLVIPGSHRRFLSCAGETPENHYQRSLKKQEIGVPDDASLREMFDTGGIAAPTGPAGSVTFFECNLMHGSNSNITPLPRSNVFIVFNSVENALVEPFCGLKPRPQHIANREDFTPLVAIEPG